MGNLKPCPFCGGEAEVVGGPENWVPTFYDPDSGGEPIAIICKKCKCGLHFFEDYSEAKADWNRRPDMWIPVAERLPESGHYVLLCCEIRPSMNRYVCDGYYAKAKSIPSNYDDECAVEYDEEQDEYFLQEGFYEAIKNWDDFSSITIEDTVTHWMPLPEPPKEVTPCPNRRNQHLQR